MTVSEREQKILGIIETQRAKRAKFRDERITMAHGAGGKATQGLIEGLLVPALDNEALAAMADAGTVVIDGTRLALTTDSFVVKPLRFPGGSIGELAVNGTVNDLAVAGVAAVVVVRGAGPLRGDHAGSDRVLGGAGGAEDLALPGLEDALEDLAALAGLSLIHI